MDKLLLKHLIYYGSFLILPYIIWLIWQLYRKPKAYFRYGMLLFCFLFVWARFIEPQMIKIQETNIPDTGILADIVLISDIHIGIYKSPAFVERMVRQINRLSVEAVYLAGDILYEIDESTLEQGIQALSRINKPIYAVLGNHDYQTYAPYEQHVRDILIKNNVQIIEQKIVDLGGYRIAGLGDNWKGQDDATFLKEHPSEKPTLVLAHNPDSVMQLPPQSVTLALSGHTHCAQIRLPWLYRHVIPSVYNFDCNLEEVKIQGYPLKVFITAGLGEIGLPMRFLNPPRIDVLHLSP